ncbi:MAG: DUF1732 domain-containing protein [Deltaproteobacteria bacterium]|nr:DUF1732 domain-containing protein [Deltaproteobacteria bacterium]
MNIKSMTGFGKFSFSLANTEYTIEAKSLNSRFLDIKIRHPFQNVALDFAIRKKIQSAVKRGRVDIYINIINSEKGSMKEDLEYLRNFSTENGLENVTLTHLLLWNRNNGKTMNQNLSDDDISVIETAVAKTLAALDSFRIREGEVLKTDLLAHHSILGGHVDLIEQHAKALPLQKKKELESRMKEYLSSENDKLAVEREVAYMLDKMDINEEIVRLRGHLSRFEKLLSDSGNGKELDFISQEILREINTTASKTPGFEISSLALQCKNEVEKLRELVANVE